MGKTGLIWVLSTLFAFSWLAPAAAQESSTNGAPASGDATLTAAVSQLEQANAIFLEDGREQEAIRIAQGLIATFEQAEDYLHLVECHFLLGEAYYFLNDWANAEHHMQSVVEVSDAQFGGDIESYPLKVLGDSQYEQGKYNDALRTYQARVSRVQARGETAELAGAQFDVAKMHLQLSQYEPAARALEQADEANTAYAAELSAPGSTATQEERDANVIDHAEITYHLAFAYFNLNQIELSRDSLAKALAFFESIQATGRYDVTDRLVAVLDNLVIIHEQLGDTTSAERFRAERDRLNR